MCGKLVLLGAGRTFGGQASNEVIAVAFETHKFHASKAISLRPRARACIEAAITAKRVDPKLLNGRIDMT